MIRLMSIVPLLAVGGDEGFRAQPLTNDGWREFDKLTPVQREILREHHGTWLRVHPHDHEGLAALGLQFQQDAEGRPKFQDPLVELAADPKAGTSIPAGSKPPPATPEADSITTDEGGSTDPVTTIATETPADIGTAGKPKKRGH